MYKRYVTLVSLCVRVSKVFVRNIFKKKSCGASPVNGEIQKSTICEVKYSEGLIKDLKYWDMVISNSKKA